MSVALQKQLNYRLIFFLYLPIKYLFFSELFQFRIFFSLSCVFSSVQSLSHVQLFATPWTAELQASLSITNSQSLLKLIFTGSVMPYNHLILCLPLLLRPSIFPSIGVFSNESILRIRWPKYSSFSSTSVLPMNIQD